MIWFSLANFVYQILDGILPVLSRILMLVGYYFLVYTFNFVIIQR